LYKEPYLYTTRNNYIHTSDSYDPSLCFVDFREVLFTNNSHDPQRVLECK